MYDGLSYGKSGICFFFDVLRIEGIGGLFLPASCISRFGYVEERSSSNVNCT